MLQNLKNLKNKKIKKAVVCLKLIFHMRMLYVNSINQSLTLGVNFINILRAAFMLADPKSLKFQLSHQYLFMLLDPSAHKLLEKTLKKLTPVIIRWLTNTNFGKNNCQYLLPTLKNPISYFNMCLKM